MKDLRKIILGLGILAVLSFSATVQAAVFQCGPNVNLCPKGDHIYCMGHGWCGPAEDCNFCQNPHGPAAAQSAEMTSYDRHALQAQSKVRSIVCDFKPAACGLNSQLCVDSQDPGYHFCQKLQN